MPHSALPVWTLLPFPVLVLAIAVLPAALPRLWHRHAFQLALSLACALPVAIFELASGGSAELTSSAHGYVTFVLTLGALFVAAGGVSVQGELGGTPRSNTALLLIGATLASAIGTTGASMLLIRPFLQANRERARRGHLVPFFILLVANIGGLLTPLGDPPLLVGYLDGVPFFWTLRLLPAWLLYVTSLGLAFYVIERRAFAREATRESEPTPKKSAPADQPTGTESLRIRGRRNLICLLLIVPATLLPSPVREVALLALALGSYWLTPRALHEANAFALSPMIEVALIFLGIFLCLAPIEAELGRAATSLPLSRAWHLFWGAGLLSSVLDNAPTYGAFTALARGLPHGTSELVAGVAPLKLAAISVGSVVMGATTYVGNGSNLMVKAVAERAGFTLPSFVRYALFAFATLLPIHLLMTFALWWLER